MAEYSYDHITLAAEHDLGAAQDRLDALAGDPESAPDQVTAAEAALAEARAVHADACGAAAAARQAEREDPEAGQ
jgi:hypothetical protein